MDIRRYLLFVVFATAILFGWNIVVIPRFFPPPPQQQEDQAAEDQADAEKTGAEKTDGEAKTDSGDQKTQAEVASKTTEPPDEPQPGEEVDPPVEPETVEPIVDPDQNPEREIVLGSMDRDSGYFLQAVVTTAGAAVRSVEFNDPRYIEINDRDEPLRLVGRESAATSESFAATFEPLDGSFRALDVASSGSRHWKVLLTKADPDDPEITQEVVLSLQSLDRKYEVLKTYRLKKVTSENLVEAREQNPEGYVIEMDITMRNLSSEPAEFSYIMQGPVGTPLENRENARKLRDFKIGVIEEDRDFESYTLTANEIVKGEANNEPEDFHNSVRYTGIDLQYFSVLLIPRVNQYESRYTATVQPYVIEVDEDDREWSDIGLRIDSELIPIEAAAEATHQYLIYAGPKREKLLEGFIQEGEPNVNVAAEEILDYGMFWAIARGMLWLLHSLNSVGIPYGIAIICLTMVVRGCMFPLSRKQAINAQKMKELQPKIQELKKKYGNDKEKFARAQMELFSKNNFNPLAGCLPLIVQLPIFIGLYTALSSSVDLRMEPFLYIDNLAAPDQIWQNWLGGFSIPFLGKDLNLLPLITIVLFQVQQKLYMPPPTDDQTAMQQKMMSYMMIFIGVLFYKVPAGLCVYFIASSLWGMAERKLLGQSSSPPGDAQGDNPAPAAPSSSPSAKRRPQPKNKSSNKKKRNKRR